MKVRIPFTLILAVALLTGATAQAQTKLPPRRPGSAAPKPRVATSVTETSLKDGLTMQKGRVVLTELGITNPLITEKKLINGTTISPTGLVTATNGTTTQISEGDQVSLSGRVTSRQAIVAADSIAKVQLYDAKYPGKRKKMEEDAARKAKDKAKRDEEKAKAKAKAEKKKK
ncbi:DUF6799 domain-containing protein [Hymenobacter terricola]|uniref:DUF6799 domain-containing protein n=1 Tax=Hymenobacter terricola TaxID=2819236 RepID=UPI001B3110FD|nr:DUF6799 domain-containing protein [Hymenobacter terricola]